MASAKFLEEALSTDVDESAVNAIVGSLETQLVTTTSSANNQGIYLTSVTGVNNNNSAIVSNGGPIISSQKHHGVTNGEILSSVNNNSVLINNSDFKTISNYNNNNNNNSSVNRVNIVTSSLAPISTSNTINSTFVNQVVVSTQHLSSNQSHQIFSTANHSNMPKSHEPVKLVYPATGTQSAVLNMNNRVTFTSQTLPNGTISLSPLTSQSQPTIMQTSTVNAAGLRTTAQQQQTLVIKNQVSMPTGITSNSPGIVTMTKSLNQATTQNMMGGQTMIPASVQIVNMRPGTPAAQAQQKTMTTLSPRIVVGNPHMVGNRPTNSANITCTLQNMQAQSGPAILLKTENGQFQLLRVGPAPGSGVTPNLAQPGNQTIRLQTVPAVSRFTGPPLALRKTIVTQQQQTITSTATGGLIVNSSITSTAPTQILTTQTSMSQPVASSAPMPALTQQNTTVVVSSNTNQTNQQRNSLDNTKEKCRKFLANLLELSSREPKPVERNVRTLIQELIDAHVEPEEFCDRLERLLNASPQPCLIGFLKKSLPLLRQSLVTKELVIEGIKAPPHSVAFGVITSSIPAQIRPIGQTVVTTGGAQVRMVAQAGPPRLAQTTITRHTAPPIRLQGSMTNVAQRPTLNTTLAQIRATGTTTILQTSNIQQLSTPPALHPVSVPTNQNIYNPIPSPQIRAQNITRPQTTLQIRATTPVVRTPTLNKNLNSTSQIKIGSTQIKPITTTSTINSVVNSINTVATTPSTTKTVTIKSQNTTQAQKQLAAAKEKEKKATTAFYHQSSISLSSSVYGDDDINDVAAMGGVNLAEESQKILGSTELIGTQIISCKDEVFLHLPALQTRIKAIMAKHGLEEPSNDVSVLISHATQERLKNVVEKLAVIAEHRIDIIKIDPRYEVTKDVRGQINFLKELDKAEQKRHEEQERELLLRAAKSRSKTEDPEQAKLKAKAKEMQRAENEELRQRDANLTALNAIGARKKPRLDGEAEKTTTTGNAGITTGTSAAQPLRPRIKRVNLRDMLFYLEQERDSCRSTMLYKAYLK